MQIKFNPNYVITPKIANFLLKIESIKEKILHMPLTPTILFSLRETAHIFQTHYSTMIEGNKLSTDQVEEVVKYNKHFPGKERDEKEIKGYYAAISMIEKWVDQEINITENIIKTLHAIVMSNGKKNIKPTPYRDGQNVIIDNKTKNIVYMPPEAKDVPFLMKSFVEWLSSEIPPQIKAAIAHYQFVTIHPYYDGNGRTARLLTNLILHLEGYSLKGIYSLEEYYALDLPNYYSAISVGDSHNCYRGRKKADITSWIEYFIKGMAFSFEKILNQMSNTKKEEIVDKTNLLRKLDPKKRRALDLFHKYEIITSKQIRELFNFKPRTGSKLCKDWVESDFLEIVDFSNKGRKYRLAKKFEVLLK